METIRTLTTDRTHLFPGARLTLDATDDATRAETPDPLDVLILFADGAVAEGVLSWSGRGASLQIEAHRTAAGTSIPAKAWDLAREADGMLRVVRRVA